MRPTIRVLLAGIVILMAAGGASVSAQEPAADPPSETAPADAPPAESPEPSAEPAMAEPDSDSAAPADAEPAPAGEEPAPKPEEPAAQEESTESTQKSFFQFVYDASPILFFIIAAMSLYLVTVIVIGFLSLRGDRLVPKGVAATVDALLKEKKYKEAYETLKGDSSPFATAVRSGVEHLSMGWDQAMDALLSVVEDSKIRFEHQISPVAVFGQLGPMIGLFGTVIGMIRAFMSISGGGQPKPAELAAEIAIALCATLEGLVLALPAIWFYAVLKNRVHRLVFDLESISESYLRRFAQAAKK